MGTHTVCAIEATKRLAGCALTLDGPAAYRGRFVPQELFAEDAPARLNHRDVDYLLRAFWVYSLHASSHRDALGRGQAWHVPSGAEV